MVFALQVRLCVSVCCRMLIRTMTQGRITKLGDVPTLAPFFFAKPDYSSAEAKKMYHSFPSANYRTSLHWCPVAPDTEAIHREGD